MIENKKIEKDLEEVNIRIKNLKVNKGYDFNSVALALVNISAAGLVHFISLMSGDVKFLALFVSILILNMRQVSRNIEKKNEKEQQIKDLEFVKKYLQEYSDKSMTIDEICKKILRMKKSSNNYNELEFLKYYLENNSLSHDEMKYKIKA